MRAYFLYKIQKKQTYLAAIQIQFVVTSVRKVLYCVGIVCDGVRKVSDGVRKVSDGVRKVSDGVRKVSDGDRSVLHGVR